MTKERYKKVCELTDRVFKDFLFRQGLKALADGVEPNIEQERALAVNHIKEFLKTLPDGNELSFYFDEEKNDFVLTKNI